MGPSIITKETTLPVVTVLESLHVSAEPDARECTQQVWLALCAGCLRIESLTVHDVRSVQKVLGSDSHRFCSMHLKNARLHA